MRRPGSCIFADYFKVQWWDRASLCWRDIQRQFPTPAAADAARPAGKRTRLMRVTMAGRGPEPGSEREAAATRKDLH